MSDERAKSPPVAHHKGSWLRTVKAVAWSMIGLRKGSEYQKDLENINPLHVIAIGVLAIFMLVLGLMVLVNSIV